MSFISATIDFDQDGLLARYWLPVKKPIPLKQKK